MDLTLIPTNDLVQELINRHDAVVLTGIKYTTKEEYVTFRIYHGNRFTCAGLIGIMSNMLAKDESGQTIVMNRNEDK